MAPLTDQNLPSSRKKENCETEAATNNYTSDKNFGTTNFNTQKFFLSIEQIKSVKIKGPNDSWFLIHHVSFEMDWWFDLIFCTLACLHLIMMTVRDCLLGWHFSTGRSAGG